MRIEDIIALTKAGFTADEIRGFEFGVEPRTTAGEVVELPEISTTRVTERAERVEEPEEKDNTGELVTLKDELRKLKARLEEEITNRQLSAVKNDVIDGDRKVTVESILNNKFNGKKETK